MRPLFLFEQKTINAVLEPALGLNVPLPSDVVFEWYDAPTLDHPQFNRDFCVGFTQRSTMQSTRSYCSAILPNTIGSDVFLTVERETNRPLMLEQMFGAAFSISYFRKYVEEIEYVLKQGSAEIFQDFSVARCRMAHVLVVNSIVCFLLCPHDATPRYSGERRIVVDAPSGHIDYAAADGRIAYIDGWLSTSVEENNRRLWAYEQE